MSDTEKKGKLMNKDFRNEVVKILREIPSPGSENYVTRFQVIRWGDGRPVLEKRTYHKVDGEWQALKLKGFTSEDIQLLQDRLDEVLTVMDSEAAECERKA